MILQKIVFQIGFATLGVIAATSVGAQPAQAPPAGVGGTYVDSQGCAWQQVDIGGQTAWAALIGAGGAQMCDLTPTVAPQQATGAARGATTAAATGATAEAADQPPQAEAAMPTEPAETVTPAPSRPRQATRRPVFPGAGHYVQVGAFEDMANADATVDALQGLGYGALRQDYPRRAGVLRVLYAGPFPDKSAATAARAAVRELGFRDAFVWAQN